MGCGSKGGGDHTKCLGNGIAQSHAYTILDLAEYRGKKLIKLRNPWSSETYCGVCSDEDTRFWRKAGKDLDHEAQDDGVFYVTLEEFHKSMLYMVVSYYEENWFHNYIEAIGDDGEKHNYLFEIKKGQEGVSYLKVDHYDTRMYPHGTKVDKIITVFTLYKWDGKKYEQIQNKIGSDWIGFQQMEQNFE